MTVVMSGPRSSSMRDRFFEQFEPEPNTGCWLWTGSITGRGYGSIKDKYKTRSAHKASYEIHNGEVPKGMFVCHTCDTPSCVNPQHLFLGTPADNMLDKVKKGRQSKLRGESHPSNKLSVDDVLFIRSSSLRNVELTKMFNVHNATISEIRNRKSWVWLGDDGEVIDGN